MQTFCKGRLVSPKAICSSPVGLTGVLFKALFEFFSSAHVHSKLNLLFWGKEKRNRREKDLRSLVCTSKHPAVYLNSLSWPHSHLSLSLWYLLLYLSLQPQGLSAVLNLKTPQRTNQQWTSDLRDSYHVTWRFLNDQKSKNERREGVLGADSFPPSSQATLEPH